MTDDATLDLDRYLARIGYDGPRAPTLEVLRALHLHHPLAIPFENLDPLRGRVPALDPAGLQAKLIDGGRGGYCFEHNLLFAEALTALGFRVQGLAARVLWNQPEGAVTPRSHMLLRVRLGNEDWIADVGFGGLTLTAPLRLEPGREQPTPHEPFRLVPSGPYLRLQALLGAEWRSLYQFDLQEQARIDYEVSNWYLATHPRSHFVTGLMAARRTAEGSHAMRGGLLTVHRTDGGEERRPLRSVAEMREALGGVFGIALPGGADLDAALARVLPQGA